MRVTERFTLSGITLRRATVLAYAAVFLVGCSGQPNRLRGIRNSARVSPVLYRGGQPSPEGFRTAKALGIKTVVSLRSTQSDHEIVEALGMRYVQVKLSPFHPTEEHVLRVMRVILDPSSQPVLLYCQAGGDRT